MHNHSVTNNQLDATCAVLEALAFYSEATTLKAYYNLNLQGKLSRDNESRRVLDLIFSTFTLILSNPIESNMFDVVCSSIEIPLHLYQNTSRENRLWPMIWRTHIHIISAIILKPCTTIELYFSINNSFPRKATVDDHNFLIWGDMHL